MQRYDCHCHVFNILSVGWKALLEQLYEASELIKERKARELVDAETLIRNKKGEEGLKRILELIVIFTGDAEKIFKKLDSYYDQEYILFPLMFDGDFLLESSKEENNSDLDEIVDVIREYLKRKKEKESDSIGNQILTEIQIDALLLLIKKVFGSKKKPKKDGFHVQLDDLKEIANNPNLKDRFMPFLGVDPRRKDIKTYLTQVGKGKFFAGVKVYPPNGFSPADPVLVGENSVFEHCRMNKIPVISHCSYGGFATPTMSINVNGYIFPYDVLEPIPINGEYSFEKGIKDGFTNMVRERAQTLNHPKIWRKVLEKYNDLILVLAHFGSGNDEWQAEILQMMKEYPNLYTDVSCMSDQTTIEKVKAIYTDNPEIRSRILYGSDYFLDMFFNDSFEQYFERMKEVLGNDIFDVFTIENPKLFMNKWYV